jgi:hypothetical protein
VVVDDFYVLRTCVGPTKANPILVVDPYTVLSLPVPTKSLQSVPWRNPKVSKFPSLVHGIELPAGQAPQHHRKLAPGCLAAPTVEQVFSSGVPKAADHAFMIARLSCYRKAPVPAESLFIVLTPIGRVLIAPVVSVPFSDPTHCQRNAHRLRSPLARSATPPPRIRFADEARPAIPDPLRRFCPNRTRVRTGSIRSSPTQSYFLPLTVGGASQRRSRSAAANPTSPDSEIGTERVRPWPGLSGFHACTLLAHRGYARYLRETEKGGLEIDWGRVRDDERFDGKYVLLSNEMDLEAGELVVG